MSSNTKQKLLLHTCCAPCFTSAFDTLKTDYDVTIFWFNPNIYPKTEHDKRFFELDRYAKIVNTPIIVGDINENIISSWESNTSSISDQSEGGPRCKSCISFRLEETAKIAKAKGFDCFATTLTVSPHKNAKMINDLGQSLMNDLGIKYLISDFKKHDGYLKSIRICREYNIYRQNYCGCARSKEN